MILFSNYLVALQIGTNTQAASTMIDGLHDALVASDRVSVTLPFEQAPSSTTYEDGR